MTETKNMEVDFHKVPDEKKSLEPRNILNDRSCEVDTNNLFEITLFQNTPSYSIWIQLIHNLKTLETNHICKKLLSCFFAL